MSLKWDQSFADFLEKTWEYYPRNLDHNSGNVLGAAVCQHSTHDGYRITASGAFLSSPPANLTIMTNSPVTKVLFEGKKVAGVETKEKKCNDSLIVKEFLELFHLLFCSRCEERSHTLSRNSRYTKAVVIIRRRTYERFERAWDPYCSRHTGHRSKSSGSYACVSDHDAKARRPPSNFIP